MSRPALCANLSLLFQEHPEDQRIDAARKAGFDGVECWFPYATPAALMRKRLHDVDIPIRMINTPPGPDALGGKGLAAIPGQEPLFYKMIKESLDYAGEVGATFLHVMAGVLPGGVARSEALGVFAANLSYAAALAETYGIMIVIEAINTRTTPGYFLNSIDLAKAVLAAVDSPQVRLLYDDFHARMIGAPVDLQALAPVIAHVQVASAPQRSEPVGVADLWKALQAAGYAGWISGEYQPARGTSEGLGWMREVRASDMRT